ncbi:MAG: enoyl-CoA hydratase/isomerase family protein [Actinomycetota bacterium]
MTVRYERRGPAAWITIDREERRNALNPEVTAGLLESLRQTAGDDEARVIVLTGAGEKAFCAGGDLGGFTTDASAADHHAARGQLGEVFLAMQQHPKPVLARVNGHALGGGYGLMLAADIAVAAADATVGTPEIDVGLWPHIITAVIQRNVPRKVALEMMLTGRRIDAAEAERWGIVNRAVPRADLDGQIEELVAKLASKSPLILRLGKESFYRAQDMAFPEALSFLNSMLTLNLLSEDVAEGVSAFLQKRAPDWKGR